MRVDGSGGGSGAGPSSTTSAAGAGVDEAAVSAASSWQLSHAESFVSASHHLSDPCGSSTAHVTHVTTPADHERAPPQPRNDAVVHSAVTARLDSNKCLS